MSDRRDQAGDPMKKIDPMWQCAEDGCEDAAFGGTSRCREHVGPGDGWVDGRFVNPKLGVETATSPAELPE